MRNVVTKSSWFIRVSLIITIFLTSMTLISCDKVSTFTDDFPEFSNVTHVFKKVDYDEMIEVLTKSPELSYIILSFKECPYCRVALPIINEVALSKNVKTVYYIDVRQMRNDNDAKFLMLKAYLSNQVDDLSTDEDGNEKIVVPDLYAVKNGKVLGHHIATVKDKDGRYIKDLTDSEKEELKTIYKQKVFID